MKPNEQGVLVPESNIYYNTPSQVARRSFFHITLAGEFVCDPTYRIERGSFYNFLLMLVSSGSGFVRYDGREQSVQANSVVLIDCAREHTYGTHAGWRSSWIHFDGSSSAVLYELITERAGSVVEIADDRVVPHYLSLVLGGFAQERPLPEALTSSYIHRMLSQLLLVAQGTPNSSHGSLDFTEDVISFIHAHYAEPLTVADLAEFACLSPFHFSRIFKSRTGYGPYEYVTKTRIDRARYLLRNSTKSVGEIASAVGFASESNFVNTFRRMTQQTPGRFRRTPI